jgi:hypothetical protein
MKSNLNPNELDPEFDDLPQTVSAHIEHLSRKWAEDEERQTRHQRHTLTRRRIEDWREERALRRQFEDDLDLD